jgi:hypothetical protein
MKLGRLQKKAFEQILTLMKSIPYENFPPQVIAELNKHGIYKKDDESMDDFILKIRNHCHKKEKTI